MPLISDAQFYRDQYARLEANQERLLEKQGAAISRQRVGITADDPPQASWAMGQQVALSRLQGQALGAAQVRAEYESIDAALGEANAILTRARATAIGARTSTQNNSDMQIWSAQAQALAGQMITVVNTRIRDRYLFAGSLDNVAPFDAAGTYSGNAVVRQVEVGNQLTLPANLPGSQVFTVAGGENVQDVLNTLAQDLSNGTFGPLGNDIDRIDHARQQVSKQMTTQGILRQRLDAADARRGQQVELSFGVLAGLTEVDVVCSSTQLRQAQVDYQRGIHAVSGMLGILDMGLR